MTEKTFEELIRTHEKIERMKGYISCQDAEKLLQQVREATGNEFIKALEGVDLPMVTTMKIMAIMATTDRIRIEP